MSPVQRSTRISGAGVACTTISYRSMTAAVAAMMSAEMTIARGLIIVGCLWPGRTTCSRHRHESPRFARGQVNVRCDACVAVGRLHHFARTLAAWQGMTAPKSSVFRRGRIKPARSPERNFGSHRVNGVSRENGAACQSQKCDCNFEHGRRPWRPATDRKPRRPCTVKDKPSHSCEFSMN